MPKITGLALSRLGVVLGCLLFSVGIGLYSIPAGFIAAGGLMVVGSLLLIDTDDTKGDRR